MMGYKPSLPELTVEMCDAIVKRIITAVDTQKIVLFGSRARVTGHRPDSDVDLLVISSSMEPRYKRSVPIYAALSDLPIEVNAEVIVYTPEEIQEWSDASSALVTTALREGRILYER